VTDGIRVWVRGAPGQDGQREPQFAAVRDLQKELEDILQDLITVLFPGTRGGPETILTTEN